MMRKLLSSIRTTTEQDWMTSTVITGRGKQREFGCQHESEPEKTRTKHDQLQENALHD